VFIVGLEDGLFPAQPSLQDPGKLQEERRLCYVGLTRAMQKLYLCHAESRRLYGKETFPRPSRFIREIPAHLLQEIRLRAQISRPAAAPAFSQSAVSRANQGSFRIGQTVRHAKFGGGVVLQCEGSGDQERVQVNFRDAGLKWLLVALAKLEV
jgi:DNA helicase II / ATP-dependent DNA helicase PcrA